ncbi:hypothetical protein OAD99_01040 [Gammaproteobacteria bacterium]|nr:hypothetical protein [Gammaproteobacteria bacterium]
MCVPVKADVKVDLPDPEFPTNILVSFSRNEIKFSKFQEAKSGGAKDSLSQEQDLI